MVAYLDRPQSSSVTGYWLKNNVLSAIIYGIVALCLYGLGYAIRDEADGGFVFSWMYYLAGLILWSFAGVAEGVLTGAALQRIVPFLPARSWVALHAAVAAILFAGFGVLGPETGGRMNRFEAPPVIFELLVIGSFGAIMGAAIGGLQALVLRAVAFGTGYWVAWSAAAYAAGMIVGVGGEMLFELDAGVAGAVARRLIDVLSAIVGSLVMLPALWRLKSRTLTLAGRAL
jgi:hypothetical protein